MYMGMADYHCLEWYIKQTKEEFDGAKEYAELSMKHKEMGDMAGAKLFNEMAMQELHHATNIHSMAVKFMNDWKKRENLAEWILDKWAKADASYVRHIGKIKYMISEFAS